MMYRIFEDLRYAIFLLLCLSSPNATTLLLIGQAIIAFPRRAALSSAPNSDLLIGQASSRHARRPLYAWPPNLKGFLLIGQTSLRHAPLSMAPNFEGLF
jgi:hypothetical protein